MTTASLDLPALERRREELAADLAPDRPDVEQKLEKIETEIAVLRLRDERAAAASAANERREAERRLAEEAKRLKRTRGEAMRGVNLRTEAAARIERAIGELADALVTHYRASLEAADLAGAAGVPSAGLITQKVWPYLNAAIYAAAGDTPVIARRLTYDIPSDRVTGTFADIDATHTARTLSVLKESDK